MKYAFVFVSVVAIWLAMVLLAIKTDVNTIFLQTVILALTVVLFLVGFRRGR